MPVVIASGVLDLDTAAQLRAVLTRLTYAGTPELVLDLTAVRFIDSTGLGVIARAGQQAKITVRGASDRIRQVFAITMLDSILHVEP